MKWVLIIVGLYLAWRWWVSSQRGSASSGLNLNPFSTMPALSDYELQQFTDAASYQLRHGNNASQQNAAAILLALEGGSSNTSLAAEQGSTQTELGNEALHARTDFNPNSLVSSAIGILSSFGF